MELNGILWNFAKVHFQELAQFLELLRNLMQLLRNPLAAATHCLNPIISTLRACNF